MSFIGTRQLWGKEGLFGIQIPELRHHVYVIGKTGVGKTTLLRNLIVQHIALGHGVGLIDPHGDLAEEILRHIPSWRADHLVCFNPADLDFPIGLNLLTNVPPDERHLVASGIVGAFKSIWHDSWGPRMAAMSRAVHPEEQRRDFFLFIDEFQNFTTDAFASILAEARK